MIKKYKLLLINPKQEYRHYATQHELSLVLGKKNTAPPLSLAYLAALTPDNYSIRIIDEEAESIPDTIEADIVGITALSNTSERALAIADLMRKKGAAVVLGGVFATYNYDVASPHVDAVVIGEGDILWREVLADFESGTLQKKYCAKEKFEYKNVKAPLWDLVDKNNYLAIPIQVTRGCPYSCEFCVVTEMFGRKMRFREIDNVLEEVGKSPTTSIFFVDDNLTINRQYAMDLFTRLKPLRKTWICQSSIEIAKDRELLSLMVEAGCEQVLIGFESVNGASLAEVHKYHNKVSDYVKAVETIQSYGIYVIASCIGGFDHDTPKDVMNIYRFSVRAKMPMIVLSMLDAPAGSALHVRLKKEGRINSMPLKYKGGMLPALHYMKMSQREIFDVYKKTLLRIYSYRSLYYKASRLFVNGGFTRKKDDSMFTTTQKMALFFKLVSGFIFSHDKYKRALFFKMFSFVRHKKVAMERMVIFLFIVDSYHKAIRKYFSNEKKLSDFITPFDKGPWEKNH